MYTTLVFLVKLVMLILTKIFYTCMVHNIQWRQSRRCTVTLDLITACRDLSRVMEAEVPHATIIIRHSRRRPYCRRQYRVNGLYRRLIVDVDARTCYITQVRGGRARPADRCDEVSWGEVARPSLSIGGRTARHDVSPLYDQRAASCPHICPYRTDRPYPREC